MILSSIVAMGTNRVIGKDNVMMWSIPSESKHYRDIVHGHYYILGRKNYEGSVKSHDHRKPIILTRNLNYQSSHPVFNDVKKAVQFAKSNGESELFILGGSEIYELAMPFISRLYLSVVEFNQSGDAYFPEHESYDWKVVEENEFQVDEQTPAAWKFQLLEKTPESL